MSPPSAWQRLRSGLPTQPSERASCHPFLGSATDAALEALLPEQPPEDADDGQDAGAEPVRAVFDFLRAKPRRRPRRRSGPLELTDFEYVVREHEAQRVAFGTSQDRRVLPLAGRGAATSRGSALALRTTDDLPDVGPTYAVTDRLSAFYDLLNKCTSLRGYGPGARRAARFRDAVEILPSPNSYDVVREDAVVLNRAPFNSSTRRKALYSSITPGPGTYDPDALRRRGQPVAVRCGAGEGPGVCEGCGQGLQEGVEFWAKESTPAVLCDPCMVSLRAAARAGAPPGTSGTKYTRWQLTYFKKTRDCSDIHRHEGTTAKILLVDPKVVDKRRRKEAYLARYFKDLKVVDRDYMPGTLPAQLDENDEEPVSSRQDGYCCLHQGLNSFNKDRMMSFGLGSHNFSTLFDTTRSRSGTGSCSTNSKDSKSRVAEAGAAGGSRKGSIETRKSQSLSSRFAAKVPRPTEQNAVLSKSPRPSEPEQSLRSSCLGHQTLRTQRSKESLQSGGPGTSLRRRPGSLDTIQASDVTGTTEGTSRTRTADGAGSASTSGTTGSSSRSQDHDGDPQRRSTTSSESCSSSFESSSETATTQPSEVQGRRRSQDAPK